MESREKGFLLVLCTAMISGFSIFINSFAAAQFDPFVFTALKNSVVAIFIFSFLYISSKARGFLRIGRSDLAKLAIWGAFDGGVGFLLFFYGLKLTTPADASLLQKSIFIFASALAAVFLKERMSWRQMAAAVILFIGAVLLSGITYSGIGAGGTMVMASVLVWSAGNVAAKKILGRIAPLDVVFGRMFFGSLLMLSFLAFTNNLPNFSSFTQNHYEWILVTSILLLGYQVTYFNGLALLKVSEATSMLVLGSVVTSLLSIFNAKLPTPAELLGMLAVVCGLALLYLYPKEAADVRNKAVQGY